MSLYLSGRLKNTKCKIVENWRNNISFYLFFSYKSKNHFSKVYAQTQILPKISILGTALFVEILMFLVKFEFGNKP